ncbi:hypothetical protein CC85DRAFT_171830 [Cutaneotrichosporon oleaginosum]|uniref:Uncharacterized protein n=1 Tax=Cutaneotrichosporon oleaginosum TaxID=879819 RepID=A0A0J0XVI8_9TREE|nr:uncharacterized protein CC85DRAFT_171830 [Cutaneotrichosporon oleaginosum]KLT45095.1 hypothetical protein CC85DRAFT_171830 [Cutaneotrichosporon oleaginosum]TXT09776.1 hypothetical protein COLE_03710 [Cutaneotrichosporon oleaginosum]
MVGLGYGEMSGDLASYRAPEIQRSAPLVSLWHRNHLSDTHGTDRLRAADCGYKESGRICSRTLAWCACPHAHDLLVAGLAKRSVVVIRGGVEPSAVPPFRRIAVCRVAFVVFVVFVVRCISHGKRLLCLVNGVITPAHARCPAAQLPEIAHAMAYTRRSCPRNAKI